MDNHVGTKIKYVVNILNFEKIKDTYYTACVYLYDLLDIKINIFQYEEENDKWAVEFITYKGFNFDYEDYESNHLIQYQFKSFEDAKEYANIEYNERMEILIDNILNRLKVYGKFIIEDFN